MQSNLALVNDVNWEYAQQACDYLQGATYQQALKVYVTVLEDPHCDNFVLAQMGLNDRYFLLTNILNRADAYKQWVHQEGHI